MVYCLESNLPWPLISSQLLSFLGNHIMDVFQSVIRTGHSTDWLIFADGLWYCYSSSILVVLILLDLSSTFDTNGHSSVLHLIPIQGSTLRWFAYSLSIKSFSVRINTLYSRLLQSHVVCHMVPSQAPSYLLYTSSHKVLSYKNTLCYILYTQ